MSKIKDDIWQDPMVKEALQERPAEDIAVLTCPKCSKLGYYNEGSHFTCRFCHRLYYVCSEDEPAPTNGRYWLRLDGHMTLADTVDYRDDGP